MVNLSENFGIPSTKESGLEQFNKLKILLKENKVFHFPSQNRGWLVLKKVNSKIFGLVYMNYLYRTKSNDKDKIEQVRV